MKGLNLIRVMAGVPVIAGFCLMQGCSSSSTATKPADTAAIVPAAPTQTVSKVEAPVEKSKLKPLPPMTTAYTVKAGETVKDIAYKFEKRWQDVVAVNTDLTEKSHLKAGQVIQLPGQVDLSKARALSKKPAAAPAPKKAAAAKPEGAVAAASSETTYVVQKNDSISSIASKHHVKRADLMSANKLTTTSTLQVGQKLVIPGGKAEDASAVAPTAPAAAAPAPAVETSGATPPPVPAAVPAVPAAGAAPAVTPAPAAPAAAAAPVAEQKFQNYTVKEGEDLYAVAIRWNVTASELKTINNLTSTELQPGQVLKIPVAATTP